jgi:hypothetical protein
LKRAFGAIVAAIFPLIVATAVDPGWSMMLMTAALFLIVEPLIGHVAHISADAPKIAAKLSRPWFRSALCLRHRAAGT